jgi:BA14K-like protein
MRIIPAAVGVLGISLIGASGTSALPINPSVIDAAAEADFSPMTKARAGGAPFGRYPSCKHLRSYNPTTRTFIGSDGRRHPCVPPRYDPPPKKWTG